MTLAELFQNVPEAQIVGNPNLKVSGISLDSREVKRGDLFVALRGETADGKRFIQNALDNGAVAVAADELFTQNLGETIPQVLFSKPREHLGELASRVYGEPSRELTVVGITGTNGKTTTAHLVEAILREAGRNPAYVGTVGYRWNGTTFDAPRTTPEAPELQKMFRTMLSESVTDVVMECSSHGVEQGRLNGLALDVAVFTNLTQDHLDFHHTFEAYRAAKWKLFSKILAGSPKTKRAAILNLDDPTGAVWAREIKIPPITFSIMPSSAATVKPIQVSLKADGISATVKCGSETLELNSSLVGAFNLSNCLAAIAVGHALGVPISATAQALENFASVPGRLQRIPNTKGVHVFVDYAHTEDALINVIEAFKPLQKKRLIVVFGCGGDRDRTKRPKMAQAVSARANVTIVTSDNPRSENPQAIIDEVLQGIPETVPVVDPSNLNSDQLRVACSMAERRAAIEQALSISRPDDIVLIAGKGHETYQEIAGIKHPFDDRKIAVEWLQRRNG